MDVIGSVSQSVSGGPALASVEDASKDYAVGQNRPRLGPRSPYRALQNWILHPKKQGLDVAEMPRALLPLEGHKCLGA